MWIAGLLLGLNMPLAATPPPMHQPVYQVRVVTATGIGRPPKHLHGPRARLMASRAAEVVAVRNLARKIPPRFARPARNFRYVAERDLDDGRVEVTVEWRPPHRGRTVPFADPGHPHQP